jgi:serine protease Do
MDRRSEAYGAGLRPGDIIVSFNDTAIDDSFQFLRLLSDTKIGSTVSLGVLRDGRRTTIKVPVEQATGRRRR